MKILVECGLVNDRKEGKWHHYSLNCETLLDFKDFIGSLTCVLCCDKNERKISMTVREKAELIAKDIKKEQGTNPVLIFKNIAEQEYVSIHGPEHHILDGASLLVAYNNAGGEIDIDQA